MTTIQEGVWKNKRLFAIFVLYFRRTSFLWVPTMNRPITTELIIANYQCKRKAFLILQGKVSGIKHEYEEILATRIEVNRLTYLISLGNSTLNIASSQAPRSSKKSSRRLSFENLEAICDALVQPKRRASKEHLSYEPHIVVGTYTVSTEQKISLAFAGYVAGEMRRYRPRTGMVVTLHQNRIKYISLHSTQR